MSAPEREKSPEQLRDTAFDLALGAVVDYYNAVVRDQREEIQRLRGEVEKSKTRAEEFRQQMMAARRA